jgi:ArsR family transcriptional regulator
MILVEELAGERARMFHALGDRTRVEIFDFLRRRCCAVALTEEGDVRTVDGPSFGEICCHVTGRAKISSTISFHLNELKAAGLITVEKRGRFMICNVNRDAVARLAAYLADVETEGCGDGC